MPFIFSTKMLILQNRDIHFHENTLECENEKKNNEYLNRKAFRIIVKIKVKKEWIIIFIPN